MRLVLFSFTLLVLFGCASFTPGIGPYKSNMEFRSERREWCARQREFNVCAVKSEDCDDYKRVCD